MSAACPLCSAGKYLQLFPSNSGSDEDCVCVECAIGKYTSAEMAGTNVCVPCAAGKFSGVPGATVCRECNLGTFTEVIGRSSVSDCTAFEPGTYSSALGATSSHCLGCQMGEYSSGSGSSNCTLCTKGKYSMFNGSVMCTMLTNPT